MSSSSSPLVTRADGVRVHISCTSVGNGSLSCCIYLLLPFSCTSTFTTCVRLNLSVICKVHFKSRGAKNSWKNLPLAKWRNEQAYDHQLYDTMKALMSYQRPS